MNLKLLCIRSNILQDVYRVAHDAIATFMFVSAVLALQKQFSVYYASSSYSFTEFTMNPHACSQFDLLNVYCMSTETLSLFTTGSEVERIDKVKVIAGDPVVCIYLNVCVKPGPNQENCSRCSKCSRTMLELYVNGDLERYAGVFDLDYFKNNPNYYFGYMYMKGKNDHFMAQMSLGSFSIVVVPALLCPFVLTAVFRSFHEAILNEVSANSHIVVKDVRKYFVDLLFGVNSPLLKLL